MSEGVAELVAEVGADFRKFSALLPISRQDGGGYVPFSYPTWRAEQRQFQEQRTGWDIVLKPRQIGFSTLELARDVWFALRHSGVQVLIVHHDQTLCESMFRVVSKMVAGLVDLGLIPKPAASSIREVVFAHNGSAIRVVEAGVTEAVADARGRSGTIHRLHATEVAFWRSAEATLAALMGAQPQEAVIESTPNGASGKFYEMVTAASEGQGRWRLHFFPWFQHAEYATPPRADFNPYPRDEDEKTLRARGCNDAQIQWWRDKVDDPASGGRERVKQEYPLDPSSCFRMPGGAYMGAETCDWLATRAREPLERKPIVVTKAGVPRSFGELLVFKRPAYGGRYAIGADVAEGEGKDESALDVGDELGETYATWASDSTEPGDFGLVLAFVARYFNDAWVAPERNNHGHTVLRAMREEETSVTPFFNVYQASDEKMGWHTNTATRPVLCDQLEQACREHSVSSPDATFAAQCRTMIRGPGGKPMGSSKGDQKAGYVGKDDRWMAKAIQFQVRHLARNNAVTSQPPPTPRRWEGAPAVLGHVEASKAEWRPGMGPPRGRSGW